MIDPSHTMEELVREWNASRLEIFHIHPLFQSNEDGDDQQSAGEVEYCGVIRFYYHQEYVDGQVAMKCIRVSSSATVGDVIPVLVEKFRPDLKNLSSDYCLSEIHSDGSERHLNNAELPLLVQLQWLHRDGRFLLRTARGQPYSSKMCTASDLYRCVPENDRLLNSFSVTNNNKDNKENGNKLYSNNKVTCPNSSDSAGTIKLFHSAGVASVMNDSCAYQTVLVSSADTIGSLFDEFSITGRLQCVYFKPDGSCEEKLLPNDDRPWHIVRQHNPSVNGMLAFRLIASNEQQSIATGPACYLIETDECGTVTEQRQLIRVSAGQTILEIDPLDRLVTTTCPEPSHRILCKLCLVSLESTTQCPYMVIYPCGEAECLINGRSINKPARLSCTGSWLLQFSNEASFRLFFYFVAVRPSKKHQSLPAPADYQLDVLPGLLEVSDETEDDFLISVFCPLAENATLLNACPLAPTLCLYMAMRHRLSLYYQQAGGLNAALRLLGKSIGLLNKMIEIPISSCTRVSGGHSLFAVLLANCTELLNLLRRDRDLSGRVTTTERTLIFALTEQCFNRLSTTTCNRFDELLHYAMSSNVLDSFAQVIDSLGSQYRGVRFLLNGDIVEQLYERIFHFINAWLLNSILLSRTVSEQSMRKVVTLLDHLENWAQAQSLCRDHLMQSRQAATYLLNNCLSSGMSEQLPDLLNRAQLNVLIRLACRGRSIGDGLYNNNDIPMDDVHESGVCRHPFVLPDTGYFIGTDRNRVPKDSLMADVIGGLSNELLSFIEPLCLSDFCRLLTNERSLGRWIEFLRPVSSSTAIVAHHHSSCCEEQLNAVKQQDDCFLIEPARCEQIRLHKRHGGLGLSIIAARGRNQPHQGIYIKSVIEGGSADTDGRLNAGDQILSANGMSFLDISQEQAASTLTTGCGSVVELSVHKAAARTHGLMSLMIPEQVQQSSRNSLEYFNEVSAERANSVNQDRSGSNTPSKSSILSAGRRHRSFKHAIDAKMRMSNTGCLATDEYSEKTEIEQPQADWTARKLDVVSDERQVNDLSRSLIANLQVDMAVDSLATDNNNNNNNNLEVDNAQSLDSLSDDSLATAIVNEYDDQNDDDDDDDDDDDGNRTSIGDSAWQDKELNGSDAVSNVKKDFLAAAKQADRKDQHRKLSASQNYNRSNAATYIDDFIEKDLSRRIDDVRFLDDSFDMNSPFENATTDLVEDMDQLSQKWSKALESPEGIGEFAKTLGTQEVYNDPRIRRLQQIKQAAILAVSAIDLAGSDDLHMTGDDKSMNQLSEPSAWGACRPNSIALNMSGVCSESSKLAPSDTNNQNNNNNKKEGEVMSFQEKMKFFKHASRQQIEQEKPGFT